MMTGNDRMQFVSMKSMQTSSSSLKTDFIAAGESNRSTFPEESRTSLYHRAEEVRDICFHRYRNPHNIGCNSRQIPASSAAFPWSPSPPPRRAAVSITKRALASDVTDSRWRWQDNVDEFSEWQLESRDAQVALHYGWGSDWALSAHGPSDHLSSHRFTGDFKEAKCTCLTLLTSSYCK